LQGVKDPKVPVGVTAASMVRDSMQPYTPRGPDQANVLLLCSPKQMALLPMQRPPPTKHESPKTIQLVRAPKCGRESLECLP
jgi:hypothetical protein